MSIGPSVCEIKDYRGSTNGAAEYLVTEPIVSALSAWIGFAWACIFLSQSSILLVFESYGFNAAQAGSFQT